MLYYTMLRRIYLKGLISKSLSDESVDSTDLERKVTEEEVRGFQIKDLCLREIKLVKERTRIMPLLDPG